MSDIQKFTDCINEKMGYSVGIIRHKNWKVMDFKKELFSGSIILFDTSEVGHGEFGEKNPEEIKKEKWKDAIGIIQYEKGKLMFTVIPKGINYTENVIRPYFNEINVCMICKSDKVHVKIDTTSGLVICKSCYNLCFEAENLKISI